MNKLYQISFRFLKVWNNCSKEQYNAWMNVIDPKTNKSLMLGRIIDDDDKFYFGIPGYNKEISQQD